MKHTFMIKLCFVFFFHFHFKFFSFKKKLEIIVVTHKPSSLKKGDLWCLWHENGINLMRPWVSYFVPCSLMNCRHFLIVYSKMSFYFFQKLELTADEQNRHPGELSRATFEVSIFSPFFPFFFFNGWGGGSWVMIQTG